MGFDSLDIFKIIQLRQKKFKLSLKRQGQRLKTRGSMLDLSKTYRFRTLVSVTSYCVYIEVFHREQGSQIKYQILYARNIQVIGRKK